ncbi:hypothetical protein [Treponema sp.]|uniref:hypothetical protein n=1 Tax=Treponema sp. TaxID=166 RepID=UPI003890A923
MKFNQIKKFIRCFYFLCISFVILFSAASCSLFSTEGSGSVTFRIDGAMAQKITEVSSRSITAARDVISSETEIQEGFYVDIALKGDYTAQKTIPVTEGASAVFEGIPVGAKISATASAYEIFPYEMEIQKILLQAFQLPLIRLMNMPTARLITRLF